MHEHHQDSAKLLQIALICLLQTSQDIAAGIFSLNGNLQQLWSHPFPHAIMSAGILFLDFSIAFSQESKGEVGAVLQQVHQGMCDDLNTPLALAALSAPLKAMNDLLSTKKGKKAKGRLHTLAQYQLALQETFRLLGMQVTDPQMQLDQMRQLALSRCVCSTCFLPVCMCSFHVLCGTLVTLCSKHRCMGLAMLNSLGGVIQHCCCNTQTPLFATRRACIHFMHCVLQTRGLQHIWVCHVSTSHPHAVQSRHDRGGCGCCN